MDVLNPPPPPPPHTHTLSLSLPPLDPLLSGSMLFHSSEKLCRKSTSNYCRRSFIVVTIACNKSYTDLLGAGYGFSGVSYKWLISSVANGWIYMMFYELFVV